MSTPEPTMPEPGAPTPSEPTFPTPSEPTTPSPSEPSPFDADTELADEITSIQAVGER
jgi:hypothetical protein